MIRYLINLWRTARGSSPESYDGYSQSLADDVRAAIQFRALAKQQVIWDSVSSYCGDACADYPMLDRFGNGIFAYHATREGDWFIIDRIWHGWPDPPEFAFFAFDTDKRIVTGQDFGDWPSAWTKPSETL